MGYSLLVVDDSAAALLMYERLLELSGIPIDELKTASDGRQALEVLVNFHADLLLTDLHMPNFDGFQLLESLKSDQRWKDLPVIIITTEGRPDRTQRALDLGAKAFIHKPFTPEEIRNLVLRTLGAEEDELRPVATGKNDF